MTDRQEAHPETDPNPKQQQTVEQHLGRESWELNMVVVLLQLGRDLLLRSAALGMVAGRGHTQQAVAALPAGLLQDTGVHMVGLVAMAVGSSPFEVQNWHSAQVAPAQLRSFLDKFVADAVQASHLDHFPIDRSNRHSSLLDPTPDPRNSPMWRSVVARTTVRFLDGFDRCVELDSRQARTGRSG